MKILIPIDDSQFAEMAVNVLVTQMKTAGAEVRLLHVLDPWPVALAKTMGSEEFPNFTMARMALRQEAERFLARTVDKLNSAGFEASYSLDEGDGDAREIILNYAERWPADLIVLGSHGRKGLQRFLLGSVSEAVARHARCTVEIVRPRPA